ncbi:hypothetical protein D9M72_622680 [compost metagenome]
MTPGRKFWINTSALVSSVFKAATSASFLRSIARLSLARLMAWKIVESPPISVSLR